MDAGPLLSGISVHPTVEQRIDLILDLTRRLELLEDLMKGARAKRDATDEQMKVVEMYQASFDVIFWS